MALSYLRRHRRWLYAFLWVVILGFIVFYIPDFYSVDAGSPAETLATVGGHPITVGEFHRAYVLQRQELARSYRDRLNPELLRSLRVPEGVLSDLAHEHLVRLEAERVGLSIDDHTLARRMATDLRYQRDGRFVGADELRALAERQGQSLPQLEEQYRQYLLREALVNLVTAGIDVTDAEVEQEYRRRNEQVRAEYVLVEAGQFEVAVTVTDDEVRQRFQASPEPYRIPERRVLAYLLLDREAITARTAVTDAEIATYYSTHRDEFRQPEQVCASHIQVRVKTGPAGEGHTDDEARRRAEALAAEIAAGAEFDEVARRSSEDRASSGGGGDLGCFGPDQFPPEFDAAAFSAEVGTVSAPVRTVHGYHLIRVNSQQPPDVLPLTQVKDRIRLTLQSGKVDDALQTTADAVANGLQRGRGLEAVAREQGLTVQNSTALARGETAPPLDSAPLVARAFELKQGEAAPEAFAVPRGLAFVSVAEVQPTRLPELPEAQERVKTDLLQEKARARAQAQAAELRSRAASVGLERAATALGLERKQTSGLVGRGQPLGDLGTGYALEQAVYALAERELSAPILVESGYAVVRVLEKKAFDRAAFEQERATLAEALRNDKRSRFFRLFMSRLQERFPVEVRTDLFRRVSS